MAVRAKFTVDKIDKRLQWAGKSGEVVQTIHLRPVSDGSEENKSFYASTPSGRIELGTVNAAAAEEFKLGEEYYVEFTAA